ncbi:putative Transcriptional repressor NF-X1 [Paratrimastix pyriformis]|uniref:Transcriptional repressor NF-X1 n=1 Tax=Paratrimastix pyriformis TaxID=342808 RepID=A0ABQ8UT74_9EUKA|nr:putative Transcriptional repressor NF-X1 [Paratrimastix pyriformis]
MSHMFLYFSFGLYTKMGSSTAVPHVGTLAHSCGEICGRSLGGGSCPHTCTQLCHPGPCPPCPMLGPPRRCYCGKIEYRPRCGDDAGCGVFLPGRSCGGVCERVLSCGLHRCRQPCHAGDCPPCQHVEVATCHCGALTREMPCGTTAFSCGKPCGRTFACGVHSCQLPCHEGPCPVCPLDPSQVSTCPCGARALASFGCRRTRCTDPIPTCDNLCRKPLVGCEHRCQEKCHIGPCPPCAVPVTLQCRCKATTQTILCSEAQRYRRPHPPDPAAPAPVPGSAPPLPVPPPPAGAPPPDPIPELLCTTVCRALRSCGRHRCMTKCCPSLHDRDDQAGVHVCPLPCGRRLNCGAHQCPHAHHITAFFICTFFSGLLSAVSVPPGTMPTLCARHVRVPALHGLPPGCPLPGSYGLPTTSCQVPVMRMCAGGHQEIRVACHVQNPTCMNACGRLLPCGVHRSAPPPPLICTVTTPGHVNPTLIALPRASGASGHPHAHEDMLPCDSQCALLKYRRELAAKLGLQPDLLAALIEPPYEADLLLAVRRDAAQILEMEAALRDHVRSPSSARPLVWPSALTPRDRSLLSALAGHHGYRVEVMPRPKVDAMVADGTVDPPRRAYPGEKLALLTPMPGARPALPLVPLCGFGNPPLVPPEERDRLAPERTLRLFDLPPQSQTRAVAQWLAPFAGTYRLCWVDDRVCHAEFADVALCHLAASVLPLVASFPPPRSPPYKVAPLIPGRPGPVGSPPPILADLERFFVGSPFDERQPDEEEVIPPADEAAPQRPDNSAPPDPAEPCLPASATAAPPAPAPAAAFSNAFLALQEEEGEEEEEKDGEGEEGKKKKKKRKPKKKKKKNADEAAAPTASAPPAPPRAVADQWAGAW